MIYNQLFIINKWACNIVNWNHSEFQEQKMKLFYKNHQIATKREENTILQSPRASYGDERRTKQNKSTKGSFNTATRDGRYRFFCFRYDTDAFKG